jgi:hypothetical protein
MYLGASMATGFERCSECSDFRSRVQHATVYDVMLLYHDVVKRTFGRIAEYCVPTM